MGYLIREQSHDSGGKFGGNVYVLQDEHVAAGNPSNGEAEKTPLPENTVNGENRQRETPSAGFPPQQNKDLTEEETKKPPKPPRGANGPASTIWRVRMPSPPAGLCGGGPGAAPGLGGVYRIADPAPGHQLGPGGEDAPGEPAQALGGPPGGQAAADPPVCGQQLEISLSSAQGRGPRRSSPCRPRDGGGTDGGSYCWPSPACWGPC